MSKRIFWYVQMVVAVLVVFGSVVLGYLLGNPLIGWLVFAGLQVLHLIELFTVSLKLGKERQIPVWEVVLKNQSLGFTWWLPLRRGITSR